VGTVTWSTTISGPTRVAGSRWSALVSLVRPTSAPAPAAAAQPSAGSVWPRSKASAASFAASAASTSAAPADSTSAAARPVRSR
jgi:hypothetical protein